MQTATQTKPEVPPHLQMGQNQSDIILDRAEDKRFVAVFYIGDWLVNSQKKSDAYRLGGKLFPDAKCVPNNFVTRCAITPLKQGMMSVNSALIEKTERRNYLKSYVATNIWNPATERFENVHVGTAGASAGLLFKPIYPAAELGQIAGRSDGVVYVPGLENASDVKEAQMHYFPDWLEIVSGRKFLPVRLAHLEDLLGNRMAQAHDEALARVGQAILQSCRDYRLFGKAYIDYQTSVIKDAEKVAGVFQRYDEIAERLFEQLEITRQDSLITDFARQNNQTAETTEEFKKAMILLANASVNSPASSEIAELKSIVANLAKVVAGQAALQAQPMPPAPPVPTDLAEYEQSLNNGQITGEVTGDGFLTDEEKQSAGAGPQTKAKTEGEKTGEIKSAPKRSR